MSMKRVNGSLSERTARSYVLSSTRPRHVSRKVAADSPVDSEAPEIPKPSISSVDMMQLGKSGLKVPVIGVGAWAWGDRSGYWGYGTQYGQDESRNAYKAILEVFGENAFIDTAEVYGFGKSEEFLGEFMKETGTSPLVASKFAPQPWRLSADAVPEACRASLKRLQLQKMALYMQHWPGFALNAFSNEAYLDGFVKVKEQGLADAIGVSNFNAQRIKGAVKRLQLADIPLASNQVQYSLLYRAPESNGVLEACKEYGVTLVAYSPLCQGLLTGKYVENGEKPYGPRKFLFTDSRIRDIQPLLSALTAISQERGKSLAQISLNWCVCKGTLPIPGAKNEKQLKEIAGALGWRLSDGEVAELDKISGKIPSSTGAPFENW